jgi:hypothetical protein
MEITLYLMITFMSILSLGEKWIALLDERGISSEAFAGNFQRFIGPAVEARTTPQDAGEDERKPDDRV